MRGVPCDEETVPLLPHVLPDVGVGGSEGGAACLKDGRATVNGDRHFTRRVAKEKREGQSLTLHHAATRGQYLSDAPDLLKVAFTKGAGDNGGSDNTCARIVGGACGVSTKHQVASVHDLGLAPNPFPAGRSSTRRKGRESRVFRGRQAADPQRFSGPPGLELLPVGRRGGAPSTPPLAFK